METLNSPHLLVIGGTGFTGQLGGYKESGTFTTAALVAGYDFTIFDDIYVDWGIAAGGAGGRITN